MPCSIRLPIRTCLISLFVTVLTSGCATTNFEPARTFAAETTKLSAAFPPMIAGTYDSCMSNAMRKQVVMGRHFNAAESEQAATSTCAPIGVSNPQAAAINDILRVYAKSISEAADSDMKDFSKEGKDLGAAIGSLQRPGSGMPIFDQGKLSLVVKLGQYLASRMTQDMQKASLRDLLAKQNEVNAASDLLKEYAQRSYRDSVETETRNLALLRTYVAGMAQTEPLAANYVDTRLYMEGKQLAERKKLADDYYVRAIDGMQASLGSLRANIDRLQEPALKRQLEQFKEQVGALERQSAFYAPVRW